MQSISRVALAASVLALSLVAVSSNDVRAAEGGLYIGAGAGTARQEGSFSGGAFDKEDSAHRVFAGYRFGWLPILDLAVEGGYRNLGKPSTDFSGTPAQVKMTGWDAAGLVILPILPIDLYAKVGFLKYDLDRRAGGVNQNSTGSAPLYGVGAGFRLWRFNVRAEYERFNVPELKRSDMMSINAYYRF